VVAIADAYVCLLEHREAGRASLTPSDALARVLGPLAPSFHPGLRAALVRALGVYPPGQVIELDDGSILRSLGGTPEDPARPVVECRAGDVTEWVAGPLPPERSVRRALPLSEWPGRARAA
jgi:HD-GYP domain-containing protein (c-di-GMP phosphodiesterase class II)